jgi:hypothetical protein
MSFRISNFRAFGPKVVELCVVEKCVVCAIFGGVLGWSFAGGGRATGISVSLTISESVTSGRYLTVRERLAAR